MKSGFLALLLFVSLPAMAQQVQLTATIHGRPQQTEILPSSDHLTVVFIHENAAEFIVLNSDFQPVFEQHISDLGLTSGATYLGVSEEQSGWHLYYVHQENLLSVRVTKRGQREIMRLEGYSNANFSGSFSFNGTMHLLRLSAWENKLRLVKFRDGKQVFSETFRISMPDFVSRAQGQFVKMSESAHHMTDSFHPAKWYRFDDRLIFTLETGNATEIVEVDLLSSVVHERKVRWLPADPQTNSNTLGVGNYLIHSSSLPDFFSMEIMDLSSDVIAYSCEVSPEGINEGGTLIGWYGHRHQLFSEKADGLSSKQEISGWLTAVHSHQHLGLSVIPSERGYFLEAGGISFEEVRGSTGMILDRIFQRDFLGLELIIPGDQKHMSAPLVFSSLRHPGFVISSRWNAKQVSVARTRSGTIEIWQE